MSGKGKGGMYFYCCCVVFPPCMNLYSRVTKNVNC